MKEPDPMTSEQTLQLIEEQRVIAALKRLIKIWPKLSMSGTLHVMRSGYMRKFPGGRTPTRRAVSGRPRRSRTTEAIGDGEANRPPACKKP